MVGQKSRPGYYRKIDFIFFNEQKIRDAVEDARFGTTPKAERNGSGVGDPTASMAIRNITPLFSVKLGDGSLEWPEHWLTVIDETKRGTHGDVLVAGMDFYAGETICNTMAKLSVSRTVCYELINEFRQFASMCAVQMGLIKIF